MRIHLEKNLYIISDGYSMEIYEVTERKNGKGEMQEYKKRLSGYCTDLEHLFQSYKKNQILSSEIEGEIEDLFKFLKKLDRQIARFAKVAEKAVADD